MKILRSGFPIVPDFGGTAHAYCGSTLDACIGDLRQWTAAPRRDDALRAYIILSRARATQAKSVCSPALRAQHRVAAAASRQHDEHGTGGCSQKLADGRLQMPPMGCLAG